MNIAIKRALISLSDKQNLDILASFLKSYNVEIISTGGTAQKLIEQGANVIEISKYTGFPEILSGRVKTLNPKVHGGLLARLDDQEHLKQMKENDIESIDLVIVNLYPFLKTLQSGAKKEDIIENIDIGGPSMLRSSAKNYEYTTVICDPEDYQDLMEEMKKHNGATSLEFRFRMAAKAFSLTASYDAYISNWFNSQTTPNAFLGTFNLTAQLKETLRYGENPHQRGAFYITDSRYGIAAAQQLQGKELSYNNINDADSALQMVMEFNVPAAIIVKHANPCGAAMAETIEQAYDKALAADPVSAFGGILAFNREITKDLAEKISPLFVEAIIAPSICEQAKQILAKKKNLRILITNTTYPSNNPLSVKSVLGGLLIQEIDTVVIKPEDLKVVTKISPSEEQMADLLFAFKICKHVKSNAIVVAKNGTTVGIGAGQMSRVDSVKIALEKSIIDSENKANGSVLASDAFFPFADSIKIAAKSGIKAIIQPSGSIRDQEVIDAANDLGIAIVHTSVRHFKH